MKHDKRLNEHKCCLIYEPNVSLFLKMNQVEVAILALTFSSTLICKMLIDSGFCLMLMCVLW